MQVSCVNPSGSAAPSDGWSSFVTGAPGYGSDNSTRCGPGNPMYGILSSAASAPVGSGENLAYQPPTGSTLSGGTVDVNLSADGGGSEASGTAVLYSPAFKYDGSDVFFQCAAGLAPCNNGTNDFSGTLQLPADRGGGFYIGAGCGGAQGFQCDSGGSNGAWALVQLRRALFLLTTSAVPTGAGFGGSALQPRVRGTGHLVFTASDPSGPGVYTVTASVDRRPVWSGSPNNNGGKCVPVGTDPASGALMFDWQQPCPSTEVVDLPVPTSRLPDGRHRLAVTVTDAAGDSSTVLDQQITTSNPLTTPVPRSHRTVHARFVIGWHWKGRSTRLLRISARHLPRRSVVNLKCVGERCPRLGARRAHAARVKTLFRALAGRVFTAGDALLITVAERGHKPERIKLLIRRGKIPLARLLRP
jgi:hypothetical protein